MSDNIFALENVKKLIEDRKPPAVIVADTNIVIDWLDFSRWETSLDDVVFLLPTFVNVEFQRLTTPATVASPLILHGDEKGSPEGLRPF